MNELQLIQAKIKACQIEIKELMRPVDVKRDELKVLRGLEVNTILAERNLAISDRLLITSEFHQTLIDRRWASYELSGFEVGKEMEITGYNIDRETYSVNTIGSGGDTGLVTNDEIIGMRKAYLDSKESNDGE